MVSVKENVEAKIKVLGKEKLDIENDLKIVQGELNELMKAGQLKQQELGMLKIKYNSIVKSLADQNEVLK